MSRSRSLMGSSLMLALTTAFVMIAVPSLVRGEVITVKVAGSPALGFAGNFSATFKYEQDHGGNNGTFNFNSSGDTHTVTYTAGGMTGTGSGAGCESFVITTSGNGGKQFKLVAHAPSVRAITIVLPTNSVIFSSPTTVALPTCGSLPSMPLTGSTFTVVEGGMTKYSGTVTSITCTP